MKKGSAQKRAEKENQTMLKKTLSIFIAIIMALSCISVTAFAEGAIDAKIKEYLVAPGQYTNNPYYGANIENTLSGQAYTASLGNFGGYVIYEFNKNIENSDRHRFGIDFMISGNAFNAAATTQEPGQVWVSQDGSTWYALAGSEHYEDETNWNYSVTYQKTESNTSTYVDNLGESGNVCTRSPYPLKASYPTVNFDENSLMLSGVLLRKNLTPSTANGIITSFGYVDALSWKMSDIPVNPYVENPQQNAKDGQFDISWAVDESGMPVHLDWVKYVKVQTATFIDGGVFGEKSTEINGVNLASDEDFTNDKSDVAITVNGKKVEFDSNNFAKLDDLGKGVDIKVTAENSNVYINNERTEEKMFAEAPAKGLVRVIVQTGDGEAQIFMLDVSSALPESEFKLSYSTLEIQKYESAQLKANLKGVTWTSSNEDVAYVDNDGKVYTINEGTATITATSPNGQTAECVVTVLPKESTETVSVTFSVSDGTIIMAPETLEVEAGIARAYGYQVASFDHNGQKVEGATVMDAIVAAHKAYYGDEFTRSTAKNYLVMNSSFIMKSFGRNTSACGFTVNGTMPNDGIINPSYGTPTGYACDTAAIVDGDSVSYYFYQDTRYYSDMYAEFNSDSYTVSAGSKLKVNIKGYSLMEHGLNDIDTVRANYMTNLKNVDIYLYENGELKKLATTNKKGNAKIKFSEEGEYTLVAVRSSDSEEAPTVVAYSNVTVTSKKDIFIIRMFKAIYNFIVKIFNKIFDGMC